MFSGVLLIGKDHGPTSRCKMDGRGYVKETEVNDVHEDC